MAATAAAVMAGDGRLVAGVVLSAQGQPLSGVRVSLLSSALVAVTDGNGRFELRGDAPVAPAVLVAEVPGLATTRRALDLAAPPVWVEVVLDLAAFKDSVTVTAVGPPEQTMPGQHLAAIDVLRTPGTFADPLYSAQMLPGVTKIDGGAGLYVRGGDVSETATYLDGALLDHPYRFATPTGGFFSSVDAVQVSGLELAAGGFPARYGNVLSGVLALDGAEAFPRTGGSVSVGLEGSSLLLSGPLGEHASGWVAGRYTDTTTLVGLSDDPETFFLSPTSTSLASQVDSDVGDGRLRLGGLWESTRVGRRLDEGNFSGPLTSEGEKSVARLGWTERAGDGWQRSAVFSYAKAKELVDVGALDLDTQDEVARLRLDATRTSGAWLLRIGGDVETVHQRWAGKVPATGGDLGGVEGVDLWVERMRREREGVYLESERTLGRFRLDAGLRYDHHTLPARQSLDPRLSVAFRPSRRQSIHLAWGLYHQAPDAPYMSTSVGSPELDLMAARHWVLSYSAGATGDPLHLRIDAYAKGYSRLPFERGGAFCSCGHGSARGVDLILLVAPRGRWSGWVGYSYLDARRLYTPWQARGRYATPDEPFRPQFAVPHTLQVVGLVRLPATFSLGVGARAAVGRPFTPIVGAVETDRGFVPRYGAIDSQRLPDTLRTDLSLSRPFMLGQSIHAIAYLGINDVFDRDDVTDYVHNTDFTQRRPARDGFGRSLYVGVTLMR
jgi:hypothetical protein